MPDSPDKDNQTEKPAAIDLSQLQGLSFGPDWSDTSPKVVARKSRDKRESSGTGNAPRRDRRPAKPPRSGSQAGGTFERDARSGRSERSESRGRGRDGGRRGERRAVPQVFHPTVDVLFYPEDSPFNALCQAIRRHCKTYELFEIAKLILEKPDRYVVVVKPKGKPDEVQPFHIAIPDGAPFTSEAEALNHVLKHHIDKFFTIEETEVEPPKGSFNCVNKCGVTGELLGPPNYHRYQALVQEHHTKQLPNMPFARFQAKIESVKDEEVIAAWVKKMTKVIRYSVKDATGDDVPTFDTLESAKNYLLAHCKDRIVGLRDQARISGRLIETLPEGPIKQSILTVLEMQRRFPLDTANNLRGRLRRMKFTVYKRGAKGVSFVCAVKRRFRDEKTVFAEDINALIDFIEKHPQISVKDLPKAYLGLDMLDEHAVQPPVEKAPDMAAAEAVLQEVSPEQADGAPAADPEQASGEQREEAPGVTTENEVVSAAAIPELSDVSEDTVAVPTVDETVTAEPQHATDSKPAENFAIAAETKSRVDYVSKHLPDADKQMIRSMMMSLQWLVQEGYVTEFGDGSLFAPTPMEDSKSKEKAVVPCPADTQVNVTEPLATEDDQADASQEQIAPQSELGEEAAQTLEQPTDNVADATGKRLIE